MTALPPFAGLLGLTVEPWDGTPVLAMPFGDVVLGRPGFLHGGAIGGLLEMAAIVALRDALGEDAVTIKPVNLSIDYRRGGRDRTTRAQGIVRRLGKRIANIDTLAWQDDREAPIATSRHIFLLKR